MLKTSIGNCALKFSDIRGTRLFWEWKNGNMPLIETAGPAGVRDEELGKGTESEPKKAPIEVGTATEGMGDKRRIQHGADRQFWRPK